jgi:hypothetical protein
MDDVDQMMNLLKMKMSHKTMDEQDVVEDD